MADRAVRPFAGPPSAGRLRQRVAAVLEGTKVAVIALLGYLPSMIRSSRGDNALTFSESSEWFGGPRTGVDQEAVEPQSTGGASARW